MGGCWSVRLLVEDQLLRGGPGAVLTLRPSPPSDHEVLVPAGESPEPSEPTLGLVDLPRVLTR